MNDAAILVMQISSSVVFCAGVFLLLFAFVQLSFMPGVRERKEAARRKQAALPVVRLSEGRFVMPDCAVCGATNVGVLADRFIALLEGKDPRGWDCPVCGVDMKDALLASDVAVELRRRLAQRGAA